MSQLSTDLRSDQLAPHSTEAEEAVIGAILINPDCLREALSVVKPDDFFIVRNAWIFEALVRMADDRMPVDYLTVVQQLEQSGKLSDVGGAQYVLSLINKTPSALNVEGYALIVSRMAYRRRLIEFAQTTARLAHSDETSIIEIHERISRELSSLSGPMVRTFTPSRVLFGDFIDDLNQKVNAAAFGDPMTGIKTGLPELDSVFGGDLGPGTYNVIFGPMGIGKTWALLQIALSAMRQCPVVYVTLENLEDSLRNRLVALESEVPYTFVRFGMINDKPMDADTHARCNNAAAELSDLPFEVIDFLSNVEEIKTHLTAATIRFGRPGICFVDTLNQLADSQVKKGRYENLTTASARLLQTMRQTGWGIVAAAQQGLGLKAGMGAKAAKEAAWPTLHSIEGARTISQHARSIIGIYSPDYIAKETHNDFFEDQDCPRGHILFVNVKANEGEGAGQARLEWRSGIPKYGPINRTKIRGDRSTDDDRKLWLGDKDGDK